MKWIGNRKSDNVEDRRGMGGGTKVALGGRLALVLLLIKSFFPKALLNWIRLNNNCPNHKPKREPLNAF